MTVSFDSEELFRYDTMISVALLDRPQAVNSSQCSLAHQLLPKDQQTKPEEVTYV